MFTRRSTSPTSPPLHAALAQLPRYPPPPQRIGPRAAFATSAILLRILTSRMKMRQCFRRRVLNIGGGVIEPLILAALVRAKFPGIVCTIRIVDSSIDVISLLTALRNRTRWEGEDPTSLTLPVGELARMGLLGALALPEDENRAVDFLVETGLPVMPESIEMLRPEQSSILDFDPGNESSYDLIVANFSIQYPIVEGYGDKVAARLVKWLAPDGVVQHGATYGAQARLLKAILPLDERLSVTYGVRELDEVTYVDDNAAETLRLRIRTDAIITRAGNDVAERITQCIFPAFPGESDVALASLRDQIARIQPNDGLESPRMAGALAGGNQCACWWVDRNVLLRHSGPLPSRVQWRYRAG